MATFRPLTVCSRQCSCLLNVYLVKVQKKSRTFDDAAKAEQAALVAKMLQRAAKGRGRRMMEFFFLAQPAPVVRDLGGI